jgi:serine/threonine-protein kinase
MARAAVPGPQAPRGSGSTSQIIVAAMRTGGAGPGGSSGAMKNLPDAGGRLGGSRERSALPFNEPTQGNEDDTVPNPRGPAFVPPPAPLPPPRPAPAPAPLAQPAPAGPTTLLISLSVALVLALAGIVILLLRK